MNKSYLLLILFFLEVVLAQESPDSIDPIVLPTSEDNIKKQKNTISTPQPIVVQSNPQPTPSQQPNNNQNTNENEKQNLQEDQKKMENANPQQTETPTNPENANPQENQLNQQNTQQQVKEPEKQPQIAEQKQNQENILKEQKVQSTPEQVVSDQPNNENMRVSVDPIVVDQKPSQSKVQPQVDPSQNQKPQQTKVPQKSQEQKKIQQQQLRKRAEKQFQQQKIRVEKQRQADEIRTRSQAAARKAQAQRLKEEQGMTDQQKRHRSEKYRVQQERIMEIKRRQKEVEEKYAQQRQYKGTPKVNYEADGQISKTQLKKQQQRQAKHKAKKVLQNFKNPGNQNFIFQIQNQTQEFAFTPSTDQLMNFDIKIYVKQMNAYSQMKNIEEDAPVKLYIYEDNRKIVSQGEFYFIGVLNTQTKANTQYILRFFNSGNEKLIEIKHTQLIQASKVQKLLDTQQAQKHAIETRSILEDVTTVIKNRKLSWVMQLQSYGQFNSRLKNYSIFQILEMVVTIGICLGQVQLIKKMLSKDSII